MQRVRLAAFLGAAAACLLALPFAAGATPIGPSCGTCQGSIYELSYGGSPISTTATSETFEITYSIDTSGYTGPGLYLDTVAVKVSSTFIDALLVDAPGGVANWVEMLGGLGSAGCSGTGSGYDCARVAALVAAPVVPGVTYEWVFQIEVPIGSLFLDNQASVKARYVGAKGIKRGALVSENTTLTNLELPEPGTGLLLLPSLALWRRGRPS